jgi:hypothetical protein
MSSESSKITRLVYNSLAISPFGSREAQWIQSIRSLRRYNRDIPVQLFLFNGAPAAIVREAHRQRVEVFELGDYAQYLDGLFVHGSLLALYPTFHKFLVLRHSPARAANHILYLDCDTFFGGGGEAQSRIGPREHAGTRPPGTRKPVCRIGARQRHTDSGHHSGDLGGTTICFSSGGRRQHRAPRNQRAFCMLMITKCFRAAFQNAFGGLSATRNRHSKVAVDTALEIYR